MAKIAIILDQLGASEFIFNEFRSKRLFSIRLVSAAIGFEVVSRGKKMAETEVAQRLKVLTGMEPCG